MDDGVLEWTIPDKPNSRHQEYRLTAKGRTLAATLAKIQIPSSQRMAKMIQYLNKKSLESEGLDAQKA